MNDILRRHAYLATLLDFKNRPLLDAVAREELERFLSSERVLGEARGALADPGASTYSLTESITREMNVDFFEMAMNWEQNPMRTKLMNVMEEIVVRDNFLEEQQEPVQQSLASSKIALFKLLYEADSRRAHGVVVQSRGTRMEALISHALEQATRGAR
jgi:hypothetical protein